MAVHTRARLRIPDHIVSLIRSLHPHIKKKIKVSLNEILTDPSCGKNLRDDLDGLQSYRVSKLRIIYRIANRNEIEIVALGPRKKIYEETLRLLRKETE